MYHVIEFKSRLQLDLERSRQQRVERLLVCPGLRLCVQLRPFIWESPAGPIEMADLFLDDGTTARGVPYARFAFVDCDH